MNILYIHQYFRTPEEGGCVRSYHLAKGLIAKGHTVTMVTAHNGADETKNIEGITVHYLSAPYDNSFSFFKRIRAFITFLVKAISVSAKTYDINLAYVMTTPLSTGVIALWVKHFRKIPYIFEVGDLWPEVPVKMRILKNPLLKYLAYWLERKVYKNAAKIVALSPEIKSYIAQIVPHKQIYTVPNFCDNENFAPTVSSSRNLKILYAGTIGLANHLEYLIDVAKACKLNQLPVHFTIVGDGARKPLIETLAKDYSNISVLPFCNQTELKRIIDEHDAFFVCFQNIPVLHSGSPNKLFDGLASGKLIVSNLSGWTKDLIEQSKCGFYYTPEKPGEFIDKIKPFLDSEALLINAQKNAREVAEKYFEKNTFVTTLDQIITNKLVEDQFKLPEHL